MSGQNAVMAPPKKNGKKPDREKYRKPYRMVRIRVPLAEAADVHSDELQQKLTQYVNDALRMRLESAGRWPPKR